MNKSIYRKPISTTYVGNQVIRAKNSLFTLAFPDNSVIKFLFICKYPVNYRFYDKISTSFSWFFSFNSNEEAINGKYFRQIYQCEAYSIRLTNAHDETEEKSFVSTCLWLLSAWLTCSVRWPMEQAKLSECGGFCQTFPPLLALQMQCYLMVVVDFCSQHLSSEFFVSAVQVLQSTLWHC